MANVNFFSPDGGTTRYPIEDTEARSRIAGQQSLLKDTVGWTGKNLLKNTTTTRTINGVTFTVNADKSVTVNGTANARVIYDVGNISDVGNYVLSGCPSGGSASTYGIFVSIEKSGETTQYENDYGSGVGFQVQNGWIAKAKIDIKSGQTVNNLTFYPMIRDASITDDTYEPYHESVEEEIEQIYADNGVLGAKNLLNISDRTLTAEGVTVSINNGVASFSGTNALTSSALWIAASGINIPKGTYIFNGLDTTQNIVTNLQLLRSDNTEIVNTNVSNPSETVIIPNDLSNCKVHFRIVANGNTNGIKAYPMLRLASDPDDTYQPYAMTNRELTEEKINIADLKTVVSASSDFADFKTRIASL